MTENKFKRAANNRLPAWVLRFQEIILVGGAIMAPEKIPMLKGTSSGCVTGENLRELDGLTTNPARDQQMIRTGSICTIAKAGEQTGAAAWARPGPGDFVMDDSFRHGFRWEMGATDAWLHNGEARADMRGSGVYLTAYRRLLEELQARGVTHCFGKIATDNAESINTHRRLGLRELARFQYTRIGGFGWYRWESPAGSGRAWTLKRSLSLRPADFLPS